MSLIKVENLTFACPGSYDNIFEHVSFQIDSDWKLGLVGRNGRGKTTFLNQEHFLLIDEPTNHLDLRARGIVSDYLNHKKGFILVSHDRSFLDGCVDHILSINRADIQVRRGNFSQWLENREKQEAAEMAANERLTKEIGRLDEAAQRSAGWSDQVEKSKFSRNSGSKVDRGYVGHKSAKMMKRAKSLRASAPPYLGRAAQLHRHRFANADGEPDPGV